MDCGTLEPLGAAEPVNLAGNSGLSYNAGSGWYTMVWKTEKSWTGTCRALVIGLVDGTEHLAYFQFK